MARARYQSLLDDPYFVAELDRIEMAPIEDDPDAAAWDARVYAAREFFDRLPGPPAVASEAPTVRTSRGRVVLELAGFLLMVGLGATTAAYVWADRVAMLLK